MARYHPRPVAPAPLLAMLLIAPIACRSIPDDPPAPPLTPPPFSTTSPPLAAPLEEYCPGERIVILGDSRPGPALDFWRQSRTRPREEVRERIKVERPALVLHLGDLVNDGSSDSWARFDREMASLREARIPIYPAVGNHELGGGGKALDNFFVRFPHLGGRRWYEVRRGPLLILVVDTNWSHLSEKEGAEQDRWYLEQLLASEGDATIRCLIVLGHQAPYTNVTNHQPSEEVEDRLVLTARPFNKVKLFASGHSHTYERFHFHGKSFVVSGGGGAPLSPVKVTDAKFPDQYAGGRNRPYNYLLLFLEEDRLLVNAMMLRDDYTWHRGDGFTIPF